MNTLQNEVASIRRAGSNEPGFTLIELLVVIAMVAALPAVLLPAVQKVREAVARFNGSASVNQLIVASQEYRNRTGSYPDSIDDLSGWNFTPLDPQVVQGKRNGYLYEIVESDQDHCRIEAKPEFPGITGSFIVGAVITSHDARSYQILSAGADEARDRMIDNIGAKAAETVARLLNLDTSATSQVRDHLESSDTTEDAFNALDANGDGKVSIEEILKSSSSVRDAELRRPFSQFLACVAREMKLDSLSEEQKRSVAVGIADLEQTRRPSELSHAVTELPIIVYASRSLIGLSQGQTLRVKALYPGNPADPQRQSAGAVRARITLCDANGTLLAQSAEGAIEPGGFHSFDFVRASIPAPGDPAGGRLQVRVNIELSAVASFTFTDDPASRGLIPASLELIDNSTGRSAAVWVTVGFFEVAPPRNP